MAGVGDAVAAVAWDEACVSGCAAVPPEGACAAGAGA